MSTPLASSPVSDNRESTRVAALDAYLEALHAGKQPDRAGLLAQHPDLEALLACLESVHRLLPSTAHWEPPAADSALAAAPTYQFQPVFPERQPSVVATPHDAVPQAAFGKYDLLGELGRGGMGVVYKARQTDLDRLVALKMILSGHFVSAEQVTRFHTEARAAARLRHPNSVQIYETGEILGQHYFAMEYIEGESLSHRLLRGRMPPEQAVRLLLPIARAVAHLHAHGVIHRDLKPSNILIDAAGRPVLTDFGLAKMLDASSHLTMTGMIVGTPSYMPPEQAASKETGPWSDVYSLGAILYELLTGRPPFQSANPLDTLVSVLESEPTLPRKLEPKIPRRLELICLKCLDKTPAQRYPDAGALVQDLERFLEGDPVAAQPQGTLERLHRWARREPALASRLAALGLCGAVIQMRYHLTHYLHLTPRVDLRLHLRVVLILAGWALISWICQRLLHRDRWANLVRGFWAAADVLLFTAVLIVVETLGSEDQDGLMLIGYPLLIAGSGLWFQVPLVWFTTAMAELGFGVLLWVAAPVQLFHRQPHHPILVAVCLAVLGFIVAHQVQRVRVLSRYYEQRL